MVGQMNATEWHHLFSQTKRAKRLYGAMIHDRRNLQKLCRGCHDNAGHISERAFCERMGIEARSKTGKL